MPEEQQAVHSFSEAPASWNAKYIMFGFECQLTIRANTGAELLPRTIAALEWLKEHEAQPTRLSVPALSTQAATQPAQAPAQPPKLADGTPDPAWCAIHGAAMSRHEKDGQVWYSHKDGENWCRGKKGK